MNKEQFFIETEVGGSKNEDVDPSSGVAERFGYRRSERVPVVVYLTPEDCSAFTDLCESWSLTRAHVIRRLIIHLLSKNGFFSADFKVIKPKSNFKNANEAVN